MTNTIKTYTRRDSATAALRKKGVDKSKYNDFITKRGDIWTVDFAALEEKVVAEPKTASKIKKAAKKVAKAAKQAKVTVSSRARELILDGLANADVFAKLKDEFSLDDSKKHYPAWYRSELRRKGLLETATA